jgi:hypothetical protein
MSDKAFAFFLNQSLDDWACLVCRRLTRIRQR